MNDLRSFYKVSYWVPGEVSFVEAIVCFEQCGKSSRGQRQLYNNSAQLVYIGQTSIFQQHLHYFGALSRGLALKSHSSECLPLYPGKGKPVVSLLSWQGFFRPTHVPEMAEPVSVCHQWLMTGTLNIFAAHNFADVSRCSPATQICKCLVINICSTS